MDADKVVKIIEKVRGTKLEISYHPYKQIVEEAKVTIEWPNNFWLQAEMVQTKFINGQKIVDGIP